MANDKALALPDLERSKALGLLAKAEVMLSQASEINDILNLREAAVGIEALATAKKMGDVAQEAKVFQLRAERKAGDWLIVAPLSPGNKGRMGERDERGRMVPGARLERGPGATPTLADLGISPDQSSEWQRIARVSERTFLKWVQECLGGGEEISRKSFLRYIRPAPEPKPAEKPLSVLDRLVDAIKAVSAILHEIGTTQQGADVKVALAQAKYAQQMVKTMDKRLDKLVEQLEKEVGGVK